MKPNRFSDPKPLTDDSFIIGMNMTKREHDAILEKHFQRVFDIIERVRKEQKERYG